MARTFHSRRPRTARDKRDDVTQVRQPKPSLRRRSTRQSIILAELKGY